MACCTCYVHALGSTGMHSTERSKFVYSKRCTQCFVELDDTHHVAAHVVAYPCWCANCCVGILTLKTTCKSCNNKNKDDKCTIDSHSFFCDIWSCRFPFLNIVCQPYCIHRNISRWKKYTTFTQQTRRSHKYVWTHKKKYC